MSQTEEQVEVTITNYLQEGNQLREEGKLNEAIATYQKGIELEPDNPNLHRCLAQVQTQQGDIPSAITSYQKTIELEPIEPFWVYQALSNCLFAQGLLEEAIAPLQEAISLQPGNAELHRQLAQILTEKQDFLGAIANYQKTIELDAKQPYWVYQALGNLLKQKGEIESSIVAYNKAIELEPNQEELYCLLAQAQTQNEHKKEAISNYQKAIELNVNQPIWVFVSLGQVLIEEGKLKEAIAIYDQFLQLQPDSKEIEAQRTIAQQQLQKKRKIDDRHSVPLKGEGDPWLLHHQKADHLRAENHLDEAIATYRHAIDVNPSYILSYQNLGDALQERGLWCQALTVYREALEFAESKNTLNCLKEKIQQLEHRFQRMEDLFSQLSPTQLTSDEIAIDAGFPLTPMQGFSTQDYDSYGKPLRWSIPGKPLRFEVFCDHAVPREIQLRLVNFFQDNLSVYCLVDNEIIQLQPKFTEDKKYLFFTGTLPKSEKKNRTIIDFIGVTDNDELNFTNLLTLEKFKDRITSIPFYRFILK